VSERVALRVTIGETIRDVGPDLAAELDRNGAGRATLRTMEGTRRVLWSRSPAGEGSGAWALELVVDGWRFEVVVEGAERAALRDRARRGAVAARSHAALVVRAPIPGRIEEVRVVVGQAVQAGEALLTLDAMKMENVVHAPRAGTIGRVAVGAGQTVELGDPLVELA
jgi:biotin carboxyl carrier protein